MSVRSFKGVVSEQAPTFMAAVSFVLFASVSVFGLQNLWWLATTPVNSLIEWVLSIVITVLAFTIAMVALADLDRKLEGEP